jgi:hypothetical protein
MRAFTRASVIPLVFATGLTAAIMGTAAAQSLGELAKQEEARRKAIKTPSKVLTNDSLRSITSSIVNTPAPPTPATGATAGAPAAAPAAAETKTKPPVDRKAEEAAWRSRIQGARDSLQRSQMFAEALQSRINGLTADFTARDDPAQRAVVATDRQKALAELDRVKNDIVQQTKAIADLQEEARKANVPPGWLR